MLTVAYEQDNPAGNGAPQPFYARNWQPPVGEIPEEQVLTHIPCLQPGDFAALDPEPIEWIVPNLIPRSNVTVMFATGETGKTTLAFQLQVAMASRQKWLGMPAATGRSLGFYSELNENETHIKYRQVADGLIERYEGRDSDLSNLIRFYPCLDAGESLHLFEMVNDFGMRYIRATKRLEWIEKQINTFGAELCVLDSLYDFLGDLPEIVRSTVAHFLGGIHQIASSTGCAFLICGHPSLKGMQDGHGYAGSTAWHDKPRSRIYLRSELDENNRPTGVRVFQHEKNTWGPKVPPFNFTWDERTHVFARMDEQDNMDLFLDIVASLDPPPSPNPHARNYVIRQVLDDTRNRTATGRRIAEQQARNLYQDLMRRGRLRVGERPGNKGPTVEVAHQHGGENEF